MANDESCRHCGYNEGAHDVGRAVLQSGKQCRGFVSTVKHKRDCPILDCNGDCAQTIADQKWRDGARAHQGSVILVITPRGVLIYGD